MPFTRRKFFKCSLAALPVGAVLGERPLAQADTIRTQSDLLTRVGVGSKLDADSQAIRDLIKTMFAMDITRAGTITEARNLDRGSLGDGDEVVVFGYGSAGEHAGLSYIWGAGETAADNAGTVLQLSDGGVGRLVMAGYDAYDPRWFGVKGDNDGSPGNGTDDTVAVQRWFDQLGNGATFQFPAKRRYNLPFACRITDTVVFKSVNGRLQGQGYSRSSTDSRNLYCDFDDATKGLLEINKRCVVSGVILDMDGSVTTGITDSGAGNESCYIDRSAILDCGGHGILNLNNVGWTVTESLLSGGSVTDIQSMVEPVTTAPSTAGGSIGIYGKSDIRLENNEIAVGFHYGALLGGTQVAAVNNHFEQCKIGLLFAGNTGRILGNRFAFNWSAGLMVGTGHLTQIAGLDMSGFIPKILNLGGNQYHNNGRDRVNNTSHNRASRALHINNRTTFRGKLFTEGEIIVGEESFNGYDGDDSFYTEFGIVVSGGGLREAHISGGKCAQLNSAETDGFGSGGALMYADTSTSWAATTAYSIGDLVIKTIDSVSHCYRCMVAGTSGSTGPVGTDYDAETDGTVTWAHLGQRINDSDSHMEFHGVSFDDSNGLLQCRYRQVEGGSETQRVVALTDGGVNTQTGAAYTLVRTDIDSDGGKTIVRDNASANTTSIPPNADVASLAGDQFSVFCKGAGTTTITPGSGVTLLGTATVAQNESAVWRQIAADEWARISS